MAVVTAGQRGEVSTHRGEAVAGGDLVRGLALIGAALVALELFFVGKWVTGPNFARIPMGPDRPTGWMETQLAVAQVGFTALGVFGLYWYIVRPWRRDGRISLDGWFCIAGVLASPFDPLSNSLQMWFNYNAYFLNFGSVLSELPGVTSLNGRGYGTAWSITVLPAIYVFCITVPAAIGCAVMRKAKQRWPGLNNLGLVGVCLAFVTVFDLVLEGVLWLPLSWWNYGGVHVPLTGKGHYYQMPLNQLVFGTLVFTSFGVLRYFKDDRGQTIMERGIDRIGGGPRKVARTRGLAVIGAVHLSLLAFYHVPQMIVAVSQSGWPADIAERRSYLRGQSCGPDVDRACPGPNTPVVRPGSGYLNWKGEYVPSAAAPR